MALQFNGSNQYLSSGSGSIFQLGSQYTIFAWVNPSNISGNKIVCAYYGSPAGLSTGWLLAVAGSQLRFDTANEVSYFSSSTFGAIPANAYQSCAVVINGSSFWLYVGSAKSSAQSLNSITYASSVFYVGGTLYSGSPSSAMFNGSIAEPAIWNAALTDAEIASLAAGFTPDQVRPQSLSLYAPLIRNLADLRLGRTITNVGGATVSTHPRIIQ